MNKDIFNHEDSFTRVLNVMDAVDSNEIALLGRALSSPIRVEIMRLLTEKPLLLSQIANKLDLQLSSTALHLKILKEAKLISAEPSTKGTGKLKWYTYSEHKLVVLQLFGRENVMKRNYPVVINVPIGDFIDARIDAQMGIASETEIIAENEPHLLFSENRHKAQIIWCKNSGFLKYALPNEYAVGKTVHDISFSMELCSEARGYNDRYPSDITFFVNDVELCTWTCPGDFGDRYGKFTPSWWFPESTKYGLLTNVSVDEEGVRLNGKLINDRVSISDLRLDEGDRTSFKIEVKRDAVHLGGFNIFGEKFGDYNSAITFTATFK